MAAAFDVKSTWGNNTGGQGTSTIDITMNVGSGANRALLVCLMCGSQGVSFPAGLALTWDNGGTNQSMTQIGSTLGADGNLTCVAALYGLINPTSGNKTLRVSWTGTTEEMHACAIAFTGVDQTSVAVAFPHGATVIHGTSTASPSSVTVTSASGNMTVACHAQNVSAWGAISGTTLAQDAATGPNLAVASNYDNGAATVTMTAAFTGPAAWESIGCDVLAAAGAATFDMSSCNMMMLP